MLSYFRLKMSNASIRIECFYVPINKSSSSEKLGYLLLKLKGAQTLSTTSNDRVSFIGYTFLIHAGIVKLHII